MTSKQGSFEFVIDDDDFIKRMFGKKLGT